MIDAAQRFVLSRSRVAVRRVFMDNELKLRKGVF